MKGFSEQFLAACSVQPKRFVGILSNAEQFCLCYRRFHNGNLTWHRTELVHFTDIRLAAIVFIEFMENICDAIKVIDYSLKKVVQAVDDIALLADIFDEDQDEEDDGFGDFVGSASGYTQSSNNITTAGCLNFTVCMDRIIKVSIAFTYLHTYIIPLAKSLPKS